MSAKLYKQECVLLRADLDEANSLVDELVAKLKEAEGVIEFYSSHENWSRRDTIFWESIDRNDCNDCRPVTCENIKLAGGRRAREYMNKYASTTSSS